MGSDATLPEPAEAAAERFPNSPMRKRHRSWRRGSNSIPRPTGPASRSGFSALLHARGEDVYAGEGRGAHAGGKAAAAKRAQGRAVARNPARADEAAAGKTIPSSSSDAETAAWVPRTVAAPLLERLTRPQATRCPAGPRAAMISERSAGRHISASCRTGSRHAGRGPGRRHSRTPQRCESSSSWRRRRWRARSRSSCSRPPRDCRCPWR